MYLSSTVVRHRSPNVVTLLSYFSALCCHAERSEEFIHPTIYFPSYLICFQLPKFEKNQDLMFEKKLLLFCLFLTILNPAIAQKSISLFNGKYFGANVAFVL
jgi:hypothetical protein